MQTCTVCYEQSPDSALICSNCKADLTVVSTVAIALKRHRDNPRVRLVKVTICGDACPACYEVMGTYSKDQVPKLPVQNCSHPHGCRCFYEPVIDDR